MNRKKTYLITLAICLISFILLSIMVKKNFTYFIDHFGQMLFQQTPHHTQHLFKRFDKIFSPETDLFYSFVISSCLLALSKAENQLNLGIYSVITISGTTLLAFIVNMIVKPLFGRIRPDGSKGFSYPSDHAMLAFALLISTAYILTLYINRTTPKLLIIISSVILTLFIGFSRVYLEKHFITDIIGGYLLSATILFSILYFANIYREKIN
ncbi:phosphatase PAP2 family protein [Lactiplantibacillus plantarum]|uniref:phosphatase PAP2 family protein n=1 Tax=Lactiplantibacillus plantarum TaxID=1590 RepID=UPI0009760C5B|nr:phosphatase PAP2 family protein [Lactiplantibacillus plantarum]MCJ2385330.1 phosphatase PAP2 family protein [Lactiplantibacillus plantarum]